MKKILLTCPFTGLEFEALQTAAGDLIVKHALTGEDVRVNWNPSNNRYYMRKSPFNYIETISTSEAAEILNVSKQRISQIVANQTIPVHIINGVTVFVKSDVVEYAQTRKVGAPFKKEGNHGTGDN